MKVIRTRGEAIDENDVELLADVIWWLKGYQAAHELSTDLDGAHIDAIRKCRVLARGLMDDAQSNIGVDEVDPADTAKF